MEKKLIELRKKIKAKKPSFVRSYCHKKKNLKACWRTADGLHNKVRLCHRGLPSRVEVGFGSPREVRGLSKEGLEFVTISNVSDLKNVDAKAQIIIISSTVGNKKRFTILDDAKKKGITVYNYKDTDKKMNSITQALSDSKKQSAEVKKRVEERLKKTSKKEEKKKEDAKQEEITAEKKK